MSHFENEELLVNTLLYTINELSLLEDYVTKKIIGLFISKKWIHKLHGRLNINHRSTNINIIYGNL